MGQALVFVGIIGICTFFNFCILVWKFKKHRFLDFCIDAFCMVCICNLFAVGLNALAIGMIASALLSIWLLLFPIKLFN